MAVTALRKLCDGPRFGLLTTLQLEPFHNSVNVRDRLCEVWKNWPTAHTLPFASATAPLRDGLLEVCCLIARDSFL